jgi:uncharacterized protein involved in exopolysaccharide biosynthesis
MQRTARQALTGLSVVPQGEEVGGLPVRRLLAAVFRARYLLFGTTLFGLLVGMFMAITQANTYVSTGKFLFTSVGAESTMIDPTRAMESASIGSGARDILDNDDLRRRVIERLGPAHILQPYLPEGAGDSGVRSWVYRVQRDWNATAEEDRTAMAALRFLQGHLVVDKPNYSDMLTVHCTANSPVLAQEILTVYMTEAVTWHLETWDDERVYEAIEQAAIEARAARDLAQRALRDFLDQKAQVSDFPTEKQRRVRAEGDAASQLLRISQDLASKQIAYDSLNDMLDGGKIPKTKLEKRKPEVDPVVQERLGTQLADVIQRIVELESKYRDSENNPEVVAARARQKNLEDALEEARARARAAPEQEVLIDNPVYVNAEAERLKLQQDLLTLQAQRKFAEGNWQETQTELRELLKLEPEYAQLDEAFAQARSSVEATQQNWHAAQSKRQLSKGKFSSLKRIQEPSFPLEKEGPNRSRIVLASLFVGLFAGFAFVILRTLPDDVVRTRDDLERIEGLAVIGIMPRLDAKNLRRHVSLREQGW